ncbi:MAG: ferredoxin family protein [Elusimicrobia bacterium]|nr:ferredoxin family protein [Elusimicrobiota bacterium]
MITKWEGIPRNEIPWNPTVDDSKCTGCRKCFEFCSHKVYEFDEKANKSIVTRPLECVVGCSSCKGLCEAEAISFPPLSILADMVKARSIKPSTPA